VDESYIKLTDMNSVNAIHDHLQGWDALMLGLGLMIQKHAITANTYEQLPMIKPGKFIGDIQ